MIVVPVAHDLVHLAAVDTARLALSLLDEVAEERGAWRKRHVVDVAVQGLVHSEHELGHATSLLIRDLYPGRERGIPLLEPRRGRVAVVIVVAELERQDVGDRGDERGL